MRVVFDAGWFVVLISLVCGATLVFAGGYLLLNYGLEPTDAGVLKPLWIRVLMGGAFAVPGLAILGGILLYLDCYVVRIEADDAARGFRVTLSGESWPSTPETCSSPVTTRGFPTPAGSA